MESQRLHSLITHVPTISRRVDLSTLTTSTGVRTRIYFTLFTLLPVIYMFDMNGGLSCFGFGKGTTLER